MWTFLPTLCERKRGRSSRARRRAYKTKKDIAHIERADARIHAQRANNAHRARAQARKANARARKAWAHARKARSMARSMVLLAMCRGFKHYMEQLVREQR